MYFVITASKDTYITDKIMANSFSASNANVGYASTLDLFRLYNESFLSGVAVTNELSRVLLKFDYDKITQLMKSNLDINHPSFQCELQLFDIMGGQATPSNFNLVLFPLSQSFDEGIGKNVVTFADLDSTNFVTASYRDGTLYPWHMSGANSQGSIDATSAGGYPADLDIIVSGNLSDGAGLQGLGVSQLFKNGSENLIMDVTKIVSATVAGILPDKGFRLSYTGSEEKDTRTRFVKRFASRHVRDYTLRPRIAVSYDDSIIDHHEDFYFDLSGSIFLKNFHRGQPANILSGSSLSPVTGSSCMLVTLRTGSFSKSVFASQHQAGTRLPHAGGDDLVNFVSGVYSASFAIPSNDSTVVDWGTTLSQMIARSGSVTFDEYWSSADGSVGYYTGSLVINRINRTAFNVSPKRVDLIVTNSKNSYKQFEKALFKVFVRDFNAEQKKFKLPIEIKSLVLEKVYYRIRDIESGKVYVPFKSSNNGTRLSSDSEGLYFEFYMDLPKGRSFTIDFLIKDGGIDLIQEASNVRFRVN